MKRESSFELLRIVAIVLITTHHLLINGLDLCGYNKMLEISKDSGLASFFNSLCVVGVNIFLLISVWFGIKHIVKGVVRLLFDCAVYGLVACLLCFVFTHCPLDFHEIINAVKFTNGWYIPNYIWLLLVSPMIERSLLNVDLKIIRIWILLFSICQFYLGYYLKFVDSSGYSAINFIYLYYVGRYLRMESLNKKYIVWAKRGIFMWLITGMLLSFVFLLVAYYYHPIDSLRFWSYNNPIVVLGSISIFMFFSIVKIRSEWINYFATSVLGIYLLLSNSLITPIRNEFSVAIFKFGGYGFLLLYALFLVFFVGCVILLVNKLRAPILNSLYNLIRVNSLRY